MDTVISLPIYPELTREQQDAVIDGRARLLRLIDARGNRMDIAQQLIEKAQRREALFGIVGLGYVGPAARRGAGQGRLPGPRLRHQRAGGGRPERRPLPRQGHLRRPAARGASDAGRFEATTDMSRMGEPDAMSICVPTPLSKFKDPDVSYIVAATDAVKRTLRRGQAIILESTTYPGHHPGDPAAGAGEHRPHGGQRLLPRVQPRAGGSGQPDVPDPQHAQGRGRNHRRLHPSRLRALRSPRSSAWCPVSTTEAAELVKLLENTFRSVNIGLVNEMAIVCDKLGRQRLGSDRGRAPPSRSAS